MTLYFSFAGRRHLAEIAALGVNFLITWGAREYSFARETGREREMADTLDDPASESSPDSLADSEPETDDLGHQTSLESD